MTSIIQLHGLTKAFQNNQALAGIDFDVKQGEIFGLLGPSGAGKTTMIKLLTGELTRTSGEITVLDQQPAHFQSSAFQANIGILSDNSALYERLTVFDNLKLFCKLYDTPIKQIDRLLEQVGLQAEKQKTVSKLSKGMKQRVLLIKAIMHQPKLVFLDEPTSALDPANSVQIHRVLRELNEAGTTIFLNTHDMEEATDLCDRVAFLHQGKIQELDTPEALRYNYSTHAFHIQTTDGEQLVMENEAQNADKIASLIEQGRIKTMHTDQPSLGQIFLKITGKELV